MVKHNRDMDKSRYDQMCEEITSTSVGVWDETLQYTEDGIVLDQLWLILDKYIATVEVKKFDRIIDRAAALDLIRPAVYTSGTMCMKDILHIEVMCKEYGQGEDDDWVGLEADDYDNIASDDKYQTFQIWI
jgi:hypothetical protein